jgi:hypothetical protein
MSARPPPSIRILTAHKRPAARRTGQRAAASESGHGVDDLAAHQVDQGSLTAAALRASRVGTIRTAALAPCSRWIRCPQGGLADSQCQAEATRSSASSSRSLELERPARSQAMQAKQAVRPFHKPFRKPRSTFFVRRWIPIRAGPASTSSRPPDKPFTDGVVRGIETRNHRCCLSTTGVGSSYKLPVPKSLRSPLDYEAYSIYRYITPWYVVA